MPYNTDAPPSRTRKSAVCIVSGGLDSVCTAAHLKEEGHTIYMLTFVYGQRARHEVQAAKQFARILNTDDHRIIESFCHSYKGKIGKILRNWTKIPPDNLRTHLQPKWDKHKRNIEN